MQKINLEKLLPSLPLLPLISHKETPNMGRVSAKGKRLKGLALVASVLTFSAALSHAEPRQAPADRERKPASFTTGSVIFFHPDGTGLNHWSAARLYFHGPDATMNWDRLPFMAAYRGHMANVPTGTSNGGATTHAFGYKVDGMGSFGKDGDGSLSPPTDRAIQSLSGFPGSLMREAANRGIPVGVVNDGHIGEPGTGAFLAEVGNRNHWQEITRQMILGRPGKNDVDPWVILGGGEADTLPAEASLLHRNVNQERGAPLNSRAGLRTDGLNLQAAWNAKGSGNLSNDPTQGDDFIVVRTRAEFERLRTALAANPRYAPRVLGLFAFQDLFNDRPEEDLIARGFVQPDQAPGQTGPAPRKASRIVLWGDHDRAEPGFNPPTFAEMTEVAITILERAARQQARADRRRFFLVAEQESSDNFGNNNNAVGVLHAIHDTDNAIGIALRHLNKHPRTMILTGADSDAGGMQLVSPATNVADGVEGQQTPMFASAPDQFGKSMQFGVLWTGTGDHHGGMLSRAAGLNAKLLNENFSQRFDNTDIYRMMHVTLFGRLLPPPAPGQKAPDRR